MADAGQALKLYREEFTDMASVAGMDAVILAVAHKEFLSFTMCQIDALFAGGKKVLLDLKGILDKNEYENAGYRYWRL